ncbi:hypothetical protein KC929_00595 [Patescibacteria group bacterium]|nr:hypothetical protein [Patescibacteria group bacterium]
MSERNEVAYYIDRYHRECLLQAPGDKIGRILFSSFQLVLSSFETTLRDIPSKRKYSKEEQSLIDQGFNENLNTIESWINMIVDDLNGRLNINLPPIDLHQFKRKIDPDAPNLGSVRSDMLAQSQQKKSV